MTRSLIKQYKQKILGRTVLVVSLFLGISTVFADDLMEQIFKPSNSYEQVVDMGDTKDAVGNSLFQGSTSIKQKDGGKRYQMETVKKEGLIMHNIRLFMRIAVVVSIPLLIINGILLIVSVTTGALKNIVKYIVYIIIGIMIILSSIGIIYLIQSTTQGTILTEMAK